MIYSVNTCQSLAPAFKFFKTNLTGSRWCSLLSMSGVLQFSVTSQRFRLGCSRRARTVNQQKQGCNCTCKPTIMLISMLMIRYIVLFFILFIIKPLSNQASPIEITKSLFPRQQQYTQILR